jgi:hypothetical protein
MGARHQALQQRLTEASLAKAFHSLFPRKNNFCSVDYAALLAELSAFSVQTRRELRSVVLRHIREAIRIDAEPLDAINAKIYRSELGNEKFSFLKRRRIFFGWEGLMRVILELEFGNRYRAFAESRDGQNTGAKPAIA